MRVRPLGASAWWLGGTARRWVALAGLAARVLGIVSFAVSEDLSWAWLAIGSLLLLVVSLGSELWTVQHRTAAHGQGSGPMSSTACDSWRRAVRHMQPTRKFSPKPIRPADSNLLGTSTPRRRRYNLFTSRWRRRDTIVLENKKRAAPAWSAEYSP
jgi:hypothetical protein